MRDIEEIRRVSKIYDDRAQVTDSIKAAGQWGNKELVNEITQEIIKKMDIKSEDIILEIGCGSGVLGNVVEENCTQAMFAPNTTFPTGEPFTKYTPGPAVLFTDTTA